MASLRPPSKRAADNGKADHPSERLDASKAHWAHELGARYARLVPYMAVTLAAYAWTFPIDRAGDPEDWSWAFIPLARNMILLNAMYASWHFLLYQSPWSADGRLDEKKFNEKNQYAPGNRHLKREIFYCNCGFIMSTAYEVVMMRLWAIGAVPRMVRFWSAPAWSVLHLLAVAYWRDFHFYFAHRLMHPWFGGYKEWGDRFIWLKPFVKRFDAGAFLYRHVHSLHHKSHNPGPWSGLSMHPGEHLVYYTCTLLPLLFTLHPIHFLFNKFHADISPLPGHDGYDKPGGGSYFQ